MSAQMMDPLKVTFEKMMDDSYFFIFVLSSLSLCF